MVKLVRRIGNLLIPRVSVVYMNRFSVRINLNAEPLSVCVGTMKYEFGDSVVYTSNH